jgi:hypothetical protein
VLGGHGFQGLAPHNDRTSTLRDRIEHLARSIEHSEQSRSSTLPITPSTRSIPAPRVDLPQGTLDLLILKAIALGPHHGWAISERIQQISNDALKVQLGSLYPALHRLERYSDATPI